LSLLYIPGWGETSRSTGEFLDVLAFDRDVISLIDGFYSIRSRRQKNGGIGNLEEYNDNTMETYDGGHADIRYDKHFQKQVKVILDQLIDKSVESK